MKKIIVALFLLIVAFLLVTYFANTTGGKDSQTTEVSHEMLITEIVQLGNLEVVKYSIQDIMEYTKTRRWLPNSTAQIKVVGEVIGCLDLSKIGPGDIYTEGDSVSILLPLPEMCHYKLDHSKSEVYNVKFGLWETAELLDDAYRQAEQHLYMQALKMGIAEKSRQNSINVLTPILRGLGFQRIDIRFRPVPEGSYEGWLKYNFTRES